MAEKAPLYQNAWRNLRGERIEEAGHSEGCHRLLVSLDNQISMSHIFQPRREIAAASAYLTVLEFSIVFGEASECISVGPSASTTCRDFCTAENPHSGGNRARHLTPRHLHRKSAIARFLRAASGGIMAGRNTESQLDEHPWSLIGSRLKTPIGQWSFWIVLILGIIVIGYLAVWIEVSHVNHFTPTNDKPAPDLEPLRLAYATAMLAVAAPCVAQLVLAINKMAGLVALVIAFAVAALAYHVSASAPDLWTVHLYGVPGLTIAVLSWWLANGEGELFQDRTTPGGPSGGDTRRSLSGGKSKVKT